MSLRPFAHGLGVVFVLAAIAGCGPHGEETPVVQLVGERSDEIKGGYEDPNDSAVVGVLNYGGGAFALCSGTLIAPNVVLTARHCAVSNTLDEIEGGVYCPQTKAGKLFAADTMYVTTKPYFTQDPENYHPTREVVGLPVDTNLFCGNDQAILILDQPIAAEEAIPLTPRVDVPLAEGEQYYAVGFGATSDSGSGSGTRRRRDNLFIDCVADTCPSMYVKETEWVGDTGICSGDSGGPALDLLNRTIGVTSRGAQGCDSPVYGYVFGWAEWIKGVTVYAAGLGGYPAPAWATGWPTDPAYSAPIGGACTQPSDCPSGHCINDGVASYCTRLCNVASPCGDGWTCDEANLGVCVQVHPPPEVPKEDEDGGGPSGDSGGCNIGPPGEDPTSRSRGRRGALRRSRSGCWCADDAGAERRSTAPRGRADSEIRSRDSELVGEKNLTSRRALLLGLPAACVLLGCSREASRPAAVRRVVSIAPSTTEAVFALGAGAEMVGRSRHCDWPPEAKTLPAVGGYADPSVEAIVALSPTLVVGARGPAGPALEQTLHAHGVTTFFPETESIDQIETMLRDLGQLLGRTEEAARVIAALRARVAEVEGSARHGPRRRAILLFDVSPIVAAGPGSFPDELLRRAGAQNVIERGGAYPTIGMEHLLALDPDVLLDAVSDAEAATGLGRVAALRNDPGWRELRAMRQGAVRAIDTSAVLRPGPRIGEGLAALARAVASVPPVATPAPSASGP